MFKYLWIVILALVALCFIWYTAACIIEAYQSTNDWPSALSRLSDEHEWLCNIWFAIVFFGIVVLFIASLCAYVDGLK